MANLFSRVAIAYALVYLTPFGANAIWWSIPAGWAVGAAVSPAPGEEWKVDADRSGRPVSTDLSKKAAWLQAERRPKGRRSAFFSSISGTYFASLLHILALT